MFLVRLHSEYNIYTCLALWKHHVNLLLQSFDHKLGSSSVLFITPPARRAWRSYKFASLRFSVLFSVSQVGLPQPRSQGLRGETVTKTLVKFVLSFQNFGEKIACAVRHNRIQPLLQYLKIIKKYWPL